jgi:hypothetical protein
MNLFDSDTAPVYLFSVQIQGPEGVNIDHAHVLIGRIRRDREMRRALIHLKKIGLTGSEFDAIKTERMENHFVALSDG